MVKEIRRFEKLRVREIEIPLYIVLQIEKKNTVVIQMDTTMNFFLEFLNSLKCFCWCYTELSLRFQVAEHMKLVGGVPRKYRSPEMPFLAFCCSNCNFYTFSFCIFSCFSEMYFNGINFNFFKILLFPFFQCRFSSGACLVIFIMKIVGDHVPNSHGKSLDPGPW